MARALQSAAASSASSTPRAIERGAAGFEHAAGTLAAPARSRAARCRAGPRRRPGRAAAASASPIAAGRASRGSSAGRARRPASPPRPAAGASCVELGQDVAPDRPPPRRRARARAAIAARARSGLAPAAHAPGAAAASVPRRRAVGVEQAALDRRVEQRLLLVLAVHLDQQRRRAGAAGRCSTGWSLTKRARAAVGADHAAQHQVVLGGDAVLGEQRAAPDRPPPARTPR